MRNTRGKWDANNRKTEATYGAHGPCTKNESPWLDYGEQTGQGKEPWDVGKFDTGPTLCFLGRMLVHYTTSAVLWRATFATFPLQWPLSTHSVIRMLCAIKRYCALGIRGPRHEVPARVPHGSRLLTATKHPVTAYSFHTRFSRPQTNVWSTVLSKLC